MAWAHQTGENQHRQARVMPSKYLQASPILFSRQFSLLVQLHLRKMLQYDLAGQLWAFLSQNQDKMGAKQEMSQHLEKARETHQAARGSL